MKRREIQKKTKEDKQNSLLKFETNLKTYPLVAAIENTDLSNNFLKSIRNEIENTMTCMVKKKIFLSKFKIENLKDKNFVFVFTDKNGIEKLKEYKYDTFLEEGDESVEEVVIDKGIIKDKELAELLPTLTKDNLEYLEEDYKICSVGEILDEKQCEILKNLKKKSKKVPVNIIQIWDSENFENNKND
jgi:mRNA turnover protein 4